MIELTYRGSGLYISDASNILAVLEIKENTYDSDWYKEANSVLYVRGVGSTILFYVEETYDQVLELIK